MITYFKLLDMINRKGLTKDQLRIQAGLASGTMTKISKGEMVNLKTINAICNVLKCQPGDILEWFPDESHENEKNIQKRVDKQ